MLSGASFGDGLAASTGHVSVDMHKDECNCSNNDQNNQELEHRAYGAINSGGNQGQHDNNATRNLRDVLHNAEPFFSKASLGRRETEEILSVCTEVVIDEPAHQGVREYEAKGPNPTFPEDAYNFGIVSMRKEDSDGFYDGFCADEELREGDQRGRDDDFGVDFLVLVVDFGIT